MPLIVSQRRSRGGHHRQAVPALSTFTAKQGVARDTELLGRSSPWTVEGLSQGVSWRRGLSAGLRRASRTEVEEKSWRSLARSGMTCGWWEWGSAEAGESLAARAGG